MTTTTEIVANAFGVGLGSATIWFPVTYFAVRKQLQLRNNLGRAWRPYLLCVVLFAIFHLLGFEPSILTTAGMITFFVMPLIVCAIVLNFTYRSELDLTRNTGKDAPKLKGLSVNPVTDNLNAMTTSVVTSKEVIAFRFLLLAWVAGFFLLCFSGFAFFKVKQETDAIVYLARLQLDCERDEVGHISECKDNSDKGYEICRQNLKLMCTYLPVDNSKAMYAIGYIWEDRAYDLIYLALAVVVLSTSLFYGIRWGITGRLKPFWSLRR